LDHPIKLCVSQITDDRSYSTTLQRLIELNPREVLVPDSHFSRPLCDVLKKHLGAKVAPLNRSFFNETRGGELMNELAAAQVQTKQHTHSHYLGRAAACALVTFAERSRGGDAIRRLVVQLDPWVEASGRLKMDSSTIKALELIVNRRTGGKEATLFSVLKKTKTHMGTRLLRGQIISPPANVHVINGRLDAVQECVDHASTGMFSFEHARDALSRMSDLDKLCSKFSNEPKRFTVRELKSEIEAVLDVRAFGNELNILVEAIGPLETTFWKAAYGSLAAEQETFSRLAEVIDQVTSPQVTSSKSDHHLQDIFCVKADVDGLLDVARIAYVQVVKEMEALIDQLREATGLAKLELKRTTGRGYHLSVPRGLESRLPPYFVQAVRYRKSILCTTTELASLNNRQARLETEILALTVARLRPVRACITEAFGNMLKVSEVVAMVDMILGFAELSQQGRYVRPKVAEKLDGEIRMMQVRHPVVETVIDDFEPRDVCLGHGQRLLVVTGENCAGKTTLLTQVATVTIMAQLGCFVPAETCDTVAFSRICTRLATDDALEENASTFSLEMVEVAAILDAVSHNKGTKPCLILMDELGRGTSTRDGLAIAAATAEYSSPALSPRPSSRRTLPGYASSLINTQSKYATYRSIRPVRRQRSILRATTTAFAWHRPVQCRTK